MLTYNKTTLSGSTNGKQIVVVGTGTGTSALIHTASSGTILDELWLYGSAQAGAYDVTLCWGGLTYPDDYMTAVVPVRQGKVLLADGKLLTNGLQVRAFTSSGTVLVDGYVNQIFEYMPPPPPPTGDLRMVYGSPTAIAFTLSSATYGRYSASVDNTINQYTDAVVRLKVTFTSVSGGLCRVWFYGSEDGTNYTGAATGLDADLTTTGDDFSGLGFKGPFTITPAATGTFELVIGSVANFMGQLPAKWGIVLERLACTLSTTASDHALEYRGVNKTIG